MLGTSICALVTTAVLWSELNHRLLLGWLAANRLMQVLDNLLSNAANYSTANEKVKVSLSRRGNGTVRVTVSNQGAGIPDPFRKQLFQKFAQADTSDSRQKGGTGLGLSIAKTIVEKMGGQIGFDSVPNETTTIYFDLPELPAA